MFGNAKVEQELREIGVAIAGLELATWAAMRAVFETNPAAAVMLREVFPALMSGISGGAAFEVKAKAEAHIRRWCPST